MIWFILEGQSAAALDGFGCKGRGVIGGWLSVGGFLRFGKANFRRHAVNVDAGSACTSADCSTRATRTALPARFTAMVFPALPKPAS